MRTRLVLSGLTMLVKASASTTLLKGDKTEVIRRLGPWRNLETVEIAALTWVDWFNTRRLQEPIGYVPPAESEARYYEQAVVA